MGTDFTSFYEREATRLVRSVALVAVAGCVDWAQPGLHTLDQATIERLAESVVPVAADDPRLPPDVTPLDSSQPAEDPAGTPPDG